MKMTSSLVFTFFLVTYPCAYGEGATESGSHDSHGSGEVMEDGLLEPCQKKLPNLDRVNRDLQLSGAAHGCRQAIRDAVTACLTLETPDGIVPQANGGISDSIKETRNLYRLGESKYMAYSNNCVAQHDHVKSVCAELRSNLSRARNGNEQTIRSQLSETRDPGARTQLIAQGKELYSDISKQIMDTRTLELSAGQALSDANLCFANQARIYQFAGDKSEAMLATIETSDQGANNLGGLSHSVQSAEHGPAGDDPAIVHNEIPISEAEHTEHDPIGARTHEALTEVATNGGSHQLSTFMEDVVEDSSTLSKVTKPLGAGLHAFSRGAGAAFPIYYGANGDYGGAAIGAGEFMVEATLPQYAMAATGVGAFTLAMFTPSEFNHCDGIILDPIEAYRTKCPLYSPASTVANETAIHTLSHE